MMKKVLTYLTILALTALPVQLISANAKTVSMQMSMAQQMMTENECQHAKSASNTVTNIEQNSAANGCCEDNSNSCQGCNDIPTASSAMTSPVMVLIQTSILTGSVLFADTSLLHGIPQKNLLKPPRTSI